MSYFKKTRHVACVFAILISSTAILMSSTTANAVEFPYVPNPQWAWGSLCTTTDPDFKKLDYRERIPRCHRSVSSSRKKRLYRMYGVPERCRKQYTIDHFIPLSMGGSNHDDNLWPEHKHVKATRQNLEFDVYVELKEGRINQETALRTIIQEKLNPPVGEVVLNDCLRIHMISVYR